MFEQYFNKYNVFIEYFYKLKKNNKNTLNIMSFEYYEQQLVSEHNLLILQ